MRAIAAACLLVSTLPVFADGGVVLARQKLQGLDITIFASPVPLQAGPADISVMVQKAEEYTPLLDAEVEIGWSAEPGAYPAWMPPCCSMETGDRVTASLGHSQNKMLYSAMMPVKSAGPSKLLVQVTRQGETVSLPVEIVAAPARPPALAYWPFLAFPPFCIGAFALHQRLKVRRRL